ncbi:MAG: hypothetical protein QM784_22010 [Polyangiaceae bacterium]
MPSAIPALRESVVALTPSEKTPNEQRPSRPDWLDAAHKDPAGFWKRYAGELISAAKGVARSAVFEWYDLFHEFAERHVGSNHAAVREYTPASGFGDVSYEVLCQRAKALAATWAVCGVGPRKTVCIVVEVGSTYVTGLLAALYCGAAITLVPPEGSSFVRWALAAAGVVAKPKPGSPVDVFVLAGAKAKPWVSCLGDACLLPIEPKHHVPAPRGAHRFAAKDVVARLFSPLGEAWDELVELTAEQLYLSSLRDGVLLLQLGPGEAVAAPGFSELQFKPALLLSTLACGGTWVELGMEELGDGRALLEGKIDVLGVTSNLRELLRSSSRLRKARLKRWFRNVAEDNDTSAWFDFTAVLAPLGIGTMNYFANVAAGGSLLFSPWSLQFGGTCVWRSPGLPCELGEPNGTGMPPLADVAMLVPGKFPKGTPGIQGGLPENAVGRLVLAVSSVSDSTHQEPRESPGGDGASRGTTRGRPQVGIPRLGSVRHADVAADAQRAHPRARCPLGFRSSFRAGSRVATAGGLSAPRSRQGALPRPRRGVRAESEIGRSEGEHDGRGFERLVALSTSADRFGERAVRTSFGSLPPCLGRSWRCANSQPSRRARRT